jgi:hypothetical protein
MPCSRFDVFRLGSYRRDGGRVLQDQAVANKFRGDEFKSFMVNCKALMEIACEGRAIDQKVSDDAKDSFIKQCIKDAVGSK